MPYIGTPPASELANLDINGQKLILDANGNTSITADTDDQIDIEIAGADDFQFTANTFTVKDGSTVANLVVSGDTAAGDNAAIGYTSAEGLILTGQGSTSDVTVKNDADETVFSIPTGTDDIRFPDNAKIEMGGSADLQIYHSGGSGNTTISETGGGSLYIDATNLYMRKSTASGESYISAVADGAVSLYYDDAVKLATSSTGVDITGDLTLPAAAELFIGDTTNANVTAGLTVNQSASDDQAISLKSSDVAHGMTDQFETDTYGILSKYGNTEGGMKIMSASDTGTIALRLQAFGASSETTKSTSGLGTISCGAYKKSSATVAVLGANENIMSVQNGGTTKFIFDSDGDFHADSSSTTFDSYDDAQLARTFDLSHNRGVISSKFDKFIAYNHEKLADLEIVGREEDGTPNHFINVTGMQRLHNGAIWQQYEKHENLLNAVYELAVEAVGEDKANEILDKNEIKLLSKNELLN